MKFCEFLISALLGAFVLNGCTAIYYDCNIDKIEDDGILPQEGTIINVPFTYFISETKFQHGEHFQPFRYRAAIDGRQYSYAISPVESMFGYVGTFPVIVPVNDSHEERVISIDVSLSSSYSGDNWLEWNNVYTGTQAALSASEKTILDDIDSWVVKLFADNLTIPFDLDASESSRALKTLLTKGDLKCGIQVSDDEISIFVDGEHCLKNYLPLNHMHVKSVAVGDICMDDYGRIIIYAENHNLTIHRATYLGKVSPSGTQWLHQLISKNMYNDLIGSLRLSNVDINL